MSDIVERMLDYAKDDHERGCNGRYYDCSCGYDAKRDPLMVEAAKTIASLRDEAENQVQWVRDLADNLIAEEAKITRLRARVAELEEALKNIRELNMEGQWAHSDLIEQEIVAALTKAGESDG